MLIFTQKQKQIWKSHLCHFIFDLWIFLVSHVLGTEQHQGSNASQCLWLSCLLSCKFTGKNKHHHSTLIFPYWAASHSDLTYCVKTSYISTSIILPLIISLSPGEELIWSKVSYTSTPCQTHRWWTSSPLCFLEVLGCSSRFHDSFKSFP